MIGLKKKQMTDIKEEKKETGLSSSGSLQFKNGLN